MEVALDKLVKFRKKLEVPQLKVLENKFGKFSSNHQQFLTIFGSHQVESLKQVYSGQVVLDLGAGKRNAGYVLARLAGARGYIGVEPFHAEYLRSEILYDRNGRPLTNGIPFAVTNVDMLTFTDSIENESVSFMISGIDEFIIPSLYASAVNEQIKRILSPTGGVYNRDSWKHLGLGSGYETKNIGIGEHISRRKK